MLARHLQTDSGCPYGDANFHLEPLLHGSHALEVLDASLNILIDGLLCEGSAQPLKVHIVLTYQTANVSIEQSPTTTKTYQVNHVRGEEGNAVLLEEALIFVKHAIEPGQQLLGAVIGVDWAC